MSAEAAEMSRGDKVFGIETPLQAPEKEQAKSAPEPEVELEIVDVRPRSGLA